MAAGNTKFVVCPASKQNKFSLGNHLKSQEDNVYSKTDIDVKSRYSIFDAILIVLSLVTHLVDTWTDIVVSVQYYVNGDYHWGSLTLGLVLLPSIVIQVFSARWYAVDGKMKGCYMWAVHVLQIQPMERYVRVLCSGWRARHTGAQSDLEQCYHQQNDVSMLRLFESFLESAPQLCLQLYIIIYTADANWLTGISASISLMSLGSSVAVYSKALRQAHLTEYTVFWPGLCLQTVWHMGVVASRVLAIVVFASVYKAWTFVFITAHWVVMTLWVTYQDTDFCQGWWEERFFNCIVGVIYLFCFFNVKEGRTRYRIALFYTILLLENGALMGAWYPYRVCDDWFTHLVLIVIFGGYGIGILCMMIYYRFCHPTGHLHMCGQNDSEPNTNDLDKDSEDNSLRQSSSDSSYTDAMPLQRKTLLKSHSSKLVVTPVAQTEYQLVDTKLLDEHECDLADDTNTSTYQHYSIDASMYLRTVGGSETKYTPHPIRRYGVMPHNITSTPHMAHGHIINGTRSSPHQNLSKHEVKGQNMHCLHDDSVLAGSHQYDDLNCTRDTANFPIKIIMRSHDDLPDVTHLTLERSYTELSNGGVAPHHTEESTDC